MRVQKRKLLKLVGLLGAVVCLMGCARTYPEQSSARAMTETTRQQPTETETYQEVSQGKAPPSTATSRIVETVDENFHIDADVVGYPADGMAGIYIGMPKVFTKEEINAFVEYCGGSITSVKEWDDGDMMYYNGTSPNGYRFSYMRGLEGVNHHPYALFQYASPEYAEIYGEYPIFRGEEFYYTNAQNTIGWMFTEPKSFSFATEKEAEESVREALEILGLPELKLFRTLYIDHATMVEAETLLTTDENFAPLPGKEDDVYPPLPDDWSEEYDAYIFSFGIAVADTPMSFHFQAGDTANYCGTDIIVLYTKHGITSLSVGTPWEVGNKVKEPASIVSAQAAMEVAKKKYSYDLKRKDKRVEEIRLEFQYFQNRDQWLLKPVWSVMVSFTNEYADGRYFDFTNIDALTGQEI